MEHRHDTLSSVFNVHGSPRSYLHVGGKVLWIEGLDPSYVELPEIGAVLTVRQIGYDEEEMVLIAKASGQVAKVKRGRFSLSALDRLSLAGNASDGFVLKRNGEEYELDLPKGTRFGGFDQLEKAVKN